MPPTADLAAIERIMKDWQQVMAVFINALPMWKPAHEVRGKLVRSRQAVAGSRQRTQRAKHNFVWDGGCFKCLSCFREKRVSRSAVDKFPCSKLSNSVRSMVEVGSQQGHLLLMSHSCASGLPVVFCGRCAAMVTSRAVNLLSPCGPPRSGWQRSAVALFNKRIHPKSRESLTQPWPFEPDAFQLVDVGATAVLASGEVQESSFGSGVGGEFGVPELPPGEVEVAGTPVASWELPAGLAGDNSSDGEDF